MEDALYEFAVRPFDVDGHVAAHAQPLGGTGGPAFRERREEFHVWFAVGSILVALDEHFADGGGEAEVAVNLERRVRGETVLEQVVLEEEVKHFSGAVAASEARPDGGAPGPGPAAARVFARGAAEEERDFGGCGQTRSRCRRNRRAWIDGEEVRSVAVRVVWAVDVLLPLLQLPPAADFVAAQAAHRLRRLDWPVRRTCFLAEKFARLADGFQEFAH